jgi:hypothetical protein
MVYNFMVIEDILCDESGSKEKDKSIPGYCLSMILLLQLII